MLKINDKLKSTMVRGAIIGAVLALIIPGRKAQEEEVVFEITDVDRAKNIIGEIRVTSEYISSEYMIGKLNEEELADSINNAIYNISNGQLQDREDFAVYCGLYEALLKENAEL